ncbi:MAG: hypothetical protein R6U32_05435, partial [Candidatus Woesearchaeota archaeon]
IGGLEISDINGMEGVKVEESDGKTILVDSRGNKYDAEGDESAIVRIEDGVVHIDSTDRLKVQTEDGDEAIFTGSGSVSEDGVFLCAEGKSCSADGDDVQLKSGEKTLHVKGTAGFDDEGNVKEMKGTLLDKAEGLKLGDNMPTEVLRKGAEIDFSNNNLNSISKSEGTRILYYEGLGDREEDVKALTLRLKKRGSASIVDGKVDGSYSKMTIHGEKGGVAQGGHFTYDIDGRKASIYGKDTEFRATDIDGESATVRNTPTLAEGAKGEQITDIYMGGVPEPENADNNFVSIDHDDNKVSAASVNNNNFEVEYGEDTVEMLHKGALSTIKRTDDLDDVEIGMWEIPKDSMGNNRLLTDIAEFTHDEDGGESSYKVTSDNEGRTDIFAKRKNSNLGDFTLKSIDNSKDEGAMAAVSDGQSIFMKMDNMKEDPEYTLQGVKSGMGLMLEDKRKDIVEEILRATGKEGIAGSIEDWKGDKLFPYNLEDAEQEEDGTAEETQEEDTEDEGDAEAEEGGEEETGEGRDEEGLSEKTRDRISDTNPNSIRAGRVNGKFYSDDPRVQNMIKDMGYGSVREFQEGAGLNLADGIAGMQTTTALLRECYITGDCNNDDLNSFSSEVHGSVDAAVTRAEENPAGSAVNNAQTEKNVERRKRETPSDENGDDGGAFKPCKKTDECPEGFYCSEEGDCRDLERYNPEYFTIPDSVYDEANQKIIEDANKCNQEGVGWVPDYNEKGQLVCKEPSPEQEEDDGFLNRLQDHLHSTSKHAADNLNPTTDPPVYELQSKNENDEENTNDTENEGSDEDDSSTTTA